jgi:hypothetical protein
MTTQLSTVLANDTWLDHYGARAGLMAWLDWHSCPITPDQADSFVCWLETLPENEGLDAADTGWTLAALRWLALRRRGDRWHRLLAQGGDATIRELRWLL